MLQKGSSVNAVIGLVLVAGAALCIWPQKTQAVPAFSRKYNMRCYTCHTIYPRLTLTGYLFKRLGFRMPPNVKQGEAAPKVRDLDISIPWRLDDTASFTFQGSATQERTSQPGTSTSTNSFNLDDASIYLAGTLPKSAFSYLAQYSMSDSDLPMAFVTYSGGKATSSYYVSFGRGELIGTEGVRGAGYSLFDSAPTIFSYSDPNNVSFDQQPVGLTFGYTWAPSDFHQAFGLTMKVTNGLNPDGNVITSGSSKNSKDALLIADWWINSKGGLSAFYYGGRKDQIQNQGAVDSFSYSPRFRRYGVFGDYFVTKELDLLAGYSQGRDDWQVTPAGPVGNYDQKGGYVEADYYLSRGFALMGRYDRVSEDYAGSGSGSSRSSVSVGCQKAVTEEGNVVLRLAYTNLRADGPFVGFNSDKLLKFDLKMGW